MALPAGVLARPLQGLVALRDAREPIHALIASLAPGGAERIVLEWLAAEAARGREVELAVLHGRRNALALPDGIVLRQRGREEPEAFLATLARDWCSARAPVSTHLIADAHLAILWSGGVRTVPVVHNSREGWRNEACAWEARHVPGVFACAEAVRAQLVESGCSIPIVALRHRPRVGAAAFDADVRREVRSELGIAPGTFLVGAIGAFKAQKDYPRAVEVLASVCARRDAAMVILGGVLDRAGLPELDRVMDTALALGVAGRLRLPGFVPEVAPYLAACDALLNVSRFEGLSMAVQEALAAGLAVVATDVGGQREIAHPALELLEAAAPPESFAVRLARHPVRDALSPNRPTVERAPRAWSLTLAWRERHASRCDTLFVTANLSAGGAQRSLVNLCAQLARGHAFAVGVCGESTHAEFAGELRAIGVDIFRPSEERDDVAIAESLLAHANARGVRTLCFWNVAPGVKLLLAKFAPARMRIVDVSPGAYAFEELEVASPFADAIAFAAGDYYARLDALVLKYAAPVHPPCRRVEVIPNGIALRAVRCPMPSHPRFLVSGRIAASKRLETVVEAFARVWSRHPAAALHLVGAVEERHAAYAEELQARAGAMPVHFRGPGAHLRHLDEPWTATVVLGTHQGSPNAVLEAMAAGIPVIANDSGGTSELVTDGETGWLLREDACAAELHRALEDVLARPEEARARSVRALERVRTRFTLEAMAERYLHVLGGEEASGHAKMAPWISATAPAAPRPSSSAPSPMTAIP